jgi:hypothetical protein
VLSAAMKRQRKYYRYVKNDSSGRMCESIDVTYFPHLTTER